MRFYNYFVACFLLSVSNEDSDAESVYLLFIAASSTQPRLDLSKQMEPPRFVKPVNGLDVPEGGQAVFEVVVTGQPLPEVAWYHEGRPIQHGPDFQVVK